MMHKSLILLSLALTPMLAAAQSTAGTVLVVPASGEVRQANDEARATLIVEEQDRDKAAAASRVNQKMKQGQEIIRKADPRASLKTRSYYSYPVYADEVSRPAGKPRAPVGWRVGQALEVTTTSLDVLPATIAAVQPLLALNGLQFGLSPAGSKTLEQARIDAALQEMRERLAMIAKGMGRNLADAVIESIDFDASGAYAQADAFAPKAMLRGQPHAEAASVEEPRFEPGETVLSQRLVARIRFK